MLAKYILAAVGAVFLVLALVRIAKDGGRVGPASRTWLIVAIVFAAVSAWLFTGGRG
jgi:hypothetical protein